MASRQVLDAAAVLPEVTTLLRNRPPEGERYGFLGKTGGGKTHAMRHLVNYIVQQRLVDLAYIDDSKNVTCRYDGQIRVDFDAMASNPPTLVKDGGYPAIVLRGDQLAIPPKKIDGERLATAGWNMARAKLRVLLVWDEAMRMCSGGRTFNTPNGECERAFVEGRDPKISIAWSTTRQQDLAGAILSETDTYFLFRLDGRETAHLWKLGKLPREVLPVIETQLGRGDFVVVRHGEWLHQAIYRFRS